MPNICRKPFYKNIVTTELFGAKKKSSKKTQNIREITYIENLPSSKGYRLCKIIGLGQKLKMPKACEKPFYKNNRVVLCKKPLKKQKILEK